MTKYVLDMTCGGKMMWFDKNNPLALFTDIRELKVELIDGRDWQITPDEVIDFRDLPYADETFKIVLFDPPHLKHLGDRSWMAKKYGVLGKGWEEDLRRGFSEGFRVLENYGVFVFKWSEDQIPVKEVLKLTKVKPLFGHTTGRSGKTKWILFMKVPGA